MQGEYMMNPILKTLNALMSVMESLVYNCKGEARGELYTLCDNLENNPAYAFEGREPLILKLREALSLFHESHDVQQTGDRYGYRLSQVSRDLWWLYEEHEGHGHPRHPVVEEMVNKRAQQREQEM
jgi:hypothetical protein